MKIKKLSISPNNSIYFVLFWITALTIFCSNIVHADQNSSPAGGNWLEINPINSFAETSQSESLNIGNKEDFTVEAFLYLPSPNTYQINGLLKYIALKQDRFILAIYGKWHMNLGYYYEIAFGIYAGEEYGRAKFIAYYFIISQYDDFYEDWNHIAAIYDKKENAIGIFFNGQLKSGWWVYLFTEIGNKFIIGNNETSFSWDWKILVDELRISNTLRYTANFTPPTSPFQPDEYTCALWHFNETKGSTVFYDSSGNNNTLTGHNGAKTEPAEIGIISITIKPTTWDIGKVNLNDIKESGIFVATNNGNVAEDFSIKVINGDGGWTAADVAGVDQFKVEADEGANGTYDVILSTTPRALATNVSANANVEFKLKYTAPTENTKAVGINQGFTIRITASKSP